MTNNHNLLEFSDRLKSAQRELIFAAAATKMVPSDGMLQKISTLENTIAAVEALIDEQRRGSLSMVSPATRPD